MDKYNNSQLVPRRSFSADNPYGGQQYARSPYEPVKSYDNFYSNPNGTSGNNDYGFQQTDKYEDKMPMPQFNSPYDPPVATTPARNPWQKVPRTNVGMYGPYGGRPTFGMNNGMNPRRRKNKTNPGSERIQIMNVSSLHIHVNEGKKKNNTTPFNGGAYYSGGYGGAGFNPYAGGNGPSYNEYE